MRCAFVGSTVTGAIPLSRRRAPATLLRSRRRLAACTLHPRRRRPRCRLHHPARSPPGLRRVGDPSHARGRRGSHRMRHLPLPQDGARLVRRRHAIQSTDVAFQCPWSIRAVSKTAARRLMRHPRGRNHTFESIAPAESPAGGSSTLLPPARLAVHNRSIRQESAPPPAGHGSPYCSQRSQNRAATVPDVVTRGRV